MRLPLLTGRHRSTIHKILARHGASRIRRGEPRQTSRGCEQSEAGALLYIDAVQAPRFDRPGHWAHGDRSERHRTRQAGTTVVIGVIDDHTRLASCELHSAENAERSRIAAATVVSRKTCEAASPGVGKDRARR